MEDEKNIVPGEQKTIREKRIANLAPYQYKKGQSGNPAGRPKGISLKEYAKMKLASMTDDEREDFLHGLPKETIWKLAEGNPQSTTDLTSKGEKLSISDEQYNQLLRAANKRSDNSNSGS